MYVQVNVGMYSQSPAEGVGCLLSLSTHSFQAGSLPEPGLCILIRLESCLNSSELIL